tara:strand:- start:735 stop:947 length:213 start_codon:yes stop_codon:yes gene_type:complete
MVFFFLTGWLSAIVEEVSLSVLQRCPKLAQRAFPRLIVLEDDLERLRRMHPQLHIAQLFNEPVVHEKLEA